MIQVVALYKHIDNINEVFHSDDKSLFAITFVGLCICFFFSFFMLFELTGRNLSLESFKINIINKLIK